MILFHHYLYTFGGTIGLSFYNEVHRLDLSIKQWELLPVTGVNPAPRYKQQALLEDNSLYIIGGRGGKETFFGDVYALDLHSLKWTLASKSTCHSDILGEGRVSHTAISHSGSFYVFGGLSDRRKADLWRFSLTQRSWGRVKQRGQTPVPRDFHTSVFCNGYIVLFGV